MDMSTTWRMRVRRMGELVPARPRRGRLLAATLAIGAVAVAATAATTNAAARASVGGTLTVASFGGALSQDGTTYWAYDPLIYEAPDGSYHPDLALSWKYGDRNKTFSLRLRPGVRFSDGTKLTAQALKTWFQYDLSVPGSSAQLYLAHLSKIVVMGPLSLTLYFNTPTPLLPFALAQQAGAGYPGSPKAVQAKTLATMTDGAGEYMLDPSQTVAGDHYTFVPNPYYWNRSAVHWKKVVVKTISNANTTLQAMETGQVQVAIGQPVSSVPPALSAGLKAFEPLSLIYDLALADRNGVLSPPLRDVRVRQALNYAVDRKSMAQALGAGFAVPIDEMAIPGDDSWDPSLKNYYPYDPAKAKQLLAAAGYPNGFSFTAVATPIVGLDTFGEALVGQLAKVGVTMDLKIEDLNSFFTDISSAKFSAFTLSWGRDPAVIQYENLWGPSKSYANPFQTTNAQISKLYYKMIAAPPAEGVKLAQETQQILMQQAWFLPVYGSPLALIYSPKVAGIKVTPKVNVFYGPDAKPAP